MVLVFGVLKCPPQKLPASIFRHNLWSADIAFILGDRPSILGTPKP